MTDNEDGLFIVSESESSFNIGDDQGCRRAGMVRDGVPALGI